MEGDDSRCHQAMMDGAEACPPQKLLQPFGIGEIHHRGRQIGVGLRSLGASGEDPSNPGQQRQEVEGEETPEKGAARRRELEQRDSAVRLQHSPELSESRLEIAEVPDPEGHGDRVKGLVRIG